MTGVCDQKEEQLATKQQEQSVKVPAKKNVEGKSAVKPEGEFEMPLTGPSFQTWPDHM